MISGANVFEPPHVQWLATIFLAVLALCCLGKRHYEEGKPFTLSFALVAAFFGVVGVNDPIGMYIAKI